jgi:D-amino peptidase
MVSGDQALSDEVAELLPWAERVVVKEGITSWSASNLAPEKAREAIRNGVRAALARLSHMQPLRVAAPVVLQVDFFRPLQADLAAIVPGVTRAGSVTVGFTGADMAEVNRALQTILGVTVATNEGYG